MSRKAFYNIFEKIKGHLEYNSNARVLCSISGEPQTLIDDGNIKIVLRDSTLAERIEFIVLHNLPGKVVSNTILTDLRNKLGALPEYLDNIAKEYLEGTPSYTLDITLAKDAGLTEEELVQLDIYLETKMNVSVVINEHVVWQPLNTVKDYMVSLAKSEEEAKELDVAYSRVYHKPKSN